MVLNLEDFKTSALSLSDFEGQLPQGKTINEKSASLLAGLQSASVDPTKETYEQTKARLLDPESQGQFTIEQQQIRDSMWENFINPAMGDVMADPNLDPEAKDNMIGAALIPQDGRQLMSSMSVLSYQAARADLNEQATDAAEQSRYSFLDSLERVNESKKRRQKAINSLELSRDQSVVGIIGDLAEVITPFAEWINTDQMLKDLTGEGAVERGGLLGQQKQALYDQIKNVPIHKRAEFTERVLEMVQNNQRVAIQDSNQMVAIETLNRMLIDNDYSNFERWFDNSISVLDAIGVGSLVGSLSKIGKAGRAKGVVEALDGEILSPERARKSGGNEARIESPFIDGEYEDITPRGVGGPDEVRAIESGTGRLKREARQFSSKEDLGPLGEEAKSFTPDEVDTGSLGREASEFKASTDPTEDEVFKAMSENTRTEVVPTSPSQIIKDVNPSVARRVHDEAMADKTGEVAKAIYGTTKTEAAAKDILPEPEIEKGKMQNKVDMGPQYGEPENARRARLANGNTAVSDKEWAGLQKRLEISFKDVEGMNLHKSSLVIRTNPDGTIGINGRYSPVDSGFASWQDAVDNAKFAFRHYGLQDEAFTPMVRRGDEWVETTAKEIEARSALSAAGAKFDDIDYAVGLKYDYRFRPEDLEVDELLTHTPGVVARAVQFLDRAPTQYLAQMGQGSVVQNLMDPASVIAPQIVNPGHVAVDRAFGLKKIYQNMFKEFGDEYSKLDKERRALMQDYIHEANFDGVPLSTTDLYNRGFTTKEIETLKKWRRGNDAMWYAANDDMVKTLRAKGMKTYVHSDSQTQLVGKPLTRGAVNSNSVIFDSVQNANITMKVDELDDFYEKGGEILRLPEPTMIDGQWVEYVKSRNTPQGGYTRAIYDGEVVMPYREGYYPVMYDANYFIEKQVKVAGGELSSSKVVVSARDSKEVAKALDMLRKADPDAVYTSRKDRRLQGELFDEGSWSNVVNSGMSSQKVRGERLGDASADLQNMGRGHLKDPLEAVNNQIHQLSQRVSMRTYMETVKNRWMQNYSQYLDLPKNKYTGEPEFPTNVGQVKPREGAPTRIVADARTNYNYLYSLQNGYINYMDEIYKGVMHYAADFMGEIGWSKAERAAFKMAKGSPTRVAKGAAFKMFISANPLRQAVIQRGQILQLAVANPTYVGTQMMADMIGIRNVRMGWKTMLGKEENKKYVDLYEEIKDTGILEAVDAHVLLRDETMRLADLSVWQKSKSIAHKPLDISQQVGFDAAEQDVLVSAWLTFRDKAIKEGKDIKSQRVKDEILAEARAYTGGMNRAGDMAYSQNTLSIAAQFFSFRHKMLLQPLTNKNLTPMKRAQLLAFNAALFGVDATLISFTVNKLFGGKPSPERDVVNDGLLDMALNAGLSLASGEKQAIDWGDFAPTEAYGMGNFFVGMWTTNLGEMIANSPSGSLLFGGNPRIHDAMKTAARYFNVVDDYEDPELATKFSDVVIASANLFSGYTNTFKARYAYQTGKKLSTSGNISDEEITKIESIMAALGFQTKTEVGYRKAYEAIYGSDYSSRGGMEEDVKTWYRELKRQLARTGTTPTEDDVSMRVMSEAWRVFGEDRPKAMDVVIGEIQKDAKSGDYSMIRTMMGRIGMFTDEEMWKVINKLPNGIARDQLTTIMNGREEVQSGN